MEQVMLDMIPTGAKAVCHVSQYDIGRTIRFNLISGGTVYTLSGTETVKVYIKKPDGTTAERNIANTSSTYVDWVIGEGDCDQAGICECELVITSGTTVIGSKNFTVKIEEDPYNEQGVVTETAGPAVIATFTTNVVDLLQEVKCSINPIQNGTPWIDSNVINKEPYIKRAVAGTASRIGNHLYDKLVGGTVAFNQLVPTANKDFTNAVTDTRDLYLVMRKSISPYTSLITTDITNTGLFQTVISSSFDGNAQILHSGSQTNISITPADAFSVISGHKYIVSMRFASIDTGTVGGLIVNDIFITDLTAMFGSTIADYIYSLEQATAGAGVAWFKALFPNDYYAYNAGELMSVKATAHVMRDASNQVVGNYALDSNLVLNGIFKLDANNKLYADGDTYESSGLVTRGYMLVNLGTTSWRFVTSANNVYLFIAEIPNIVSRPASNYTIKAITNNPKISIGTQATWTSSMYQLSGYNSGANAILFTFDNNSASDVADFMNGTYLVCEVETPTTEQASPFTNPQVCDENGTEEYTDSRAVAIPVGHETYQANICEITGFDELNIKQSGQDTSEIAKLIRLVFDDTVYLAEVSCLNGVWKLKLLGAEVDLGSLSWSQANTATSGKYRFAASANPLPKRTGTSTNLPNIICSNYATKTPSQTYSNNDGVTIGNTDSAFIYLYDERFCTETPANFKTAMNGIKLVYELATPIEITLDETEQFEALLGVNNVWHDGNGNTEVKYLYNA